MAKDGNCSLEFFPPKTLAGRLKLLEETLPQLLLSSMPLTAR